MDEIGEMVMRLTGDASGFEDMWKVAEEMTAEASKEIEDQAKGAEDALNDLAETISNGLDTGGGNDAMSEYLDSLASSVKDAQESIKPSSWHNFWEMLNNIRESTEGTSEKLRDVSEVLEQVDEATLAAALSSAGLSEGLAEFLSMIPGMVAGFLSMAAATWDYAASVIVLLPEVWAAVAALYALLAPFIPLIAIAAVFVGIIGAVGYGLYSMHQESVKAAEAAKELQDEIDKVNEKLKEEGTHIGRTKDEIQLYELRMKGATEAQLQETIALQKANKEQQDAFDRRAKTTKAIEEHYEMVKKAMDAAKLEADIVGMSATQQEAARLVAKGFTETEAAKLMAITEATKATKEAIDEQKKLEESGKAVVANLEEQVRQFGMSAAQKAIDKAASEGQDDATIGAIYSLYQQLDALEANAKATKELEDAEKKRQDAVNSIVEGAEEQAATLGKVGRELAIYKAMQKEATDEELASINASWDKIEAFEAEKKMIESARKETEKYLTPLEKYNKRVEELKKLREFKGEDFEETFQRGLKDAQEQLNKADLKVQVKVDFDSSATREGTSEFFKAINESANRLVATGVQQHVIDATKEGGKPVSGNPQPNEGGVPGAEQGDEGLLKKEWLVFLERIAVGVETLVEEPQIEISPLGLA